MKSFLLFLSIVVLCTALSNAQTKSHGQVAEAESNHNFSAAAHTMPFASSGTLPGTCAANTEHYVKTGSNDIRLMRCASAGNAWVNAVNTDEAGPTTWVAMTWPTEYWSSAKIRANGTISSSDLNNAGIVETLSVHLTIPNIATYDGTATVPHGAAVSGVARSGSDAIAAVGIYGEGKLTEASTQSIFGGKFIASNHGFATTASMFGIEVVMNQITDGAANAYGMRITGTSDLQVDTLSNAVNIRAMGQLASPKIPWQYGIDLEAAAATVGIRLGPNADGNSIPSQGIQFRNTNGSGTLQTGTLSQSALGILELAGFNGSSLNGVTDTEMKTKSFGFVIGADNGAVLQDTDDQATIFHNNLYALTITEVYCETDAGTTIINLQRDDGSPANILSSNLSCTTGGATGTISLSEDNVALTQKVDFVMVTAGGVAKSTRVFVKYTID